MTQGSLSSILNQNKLIGDNFADWKRNLLIVLFFEKHKYVLEKDCPPVPKENASSEESMTFDNWVNSNEIARYYMMASMNSVLQKQHEGYLNARDIMHNVEDMFGGQYVLVRQAAVRNLMNCKHKPETPIKDHMLTVIGYLAEAQSHGSEIDADTQMEMIFESLSKEFIPFRTILNLTFESMIKSKGIETNLTEAGNSSKPSNGKGKKFKQVVSKTSSIPTFDNKVKKKKKKNSKKAKCFACGKVGHFKRDCKANLAKKSK
ncbi:hypothetical protein UlMin_041383 [Ulmus minor]